MFGHTATDISTSFSDSVSELSHALAQFGRGVSSVCATSARFTKDTARAHYNVLGQYTFPIEQECYGNTDAAIPKPYDLNWIGQTVLTIPVPLTLISHLAALTLFPLLGNSAQSLIRAYVGSSNLALFDLPDHQLGMPNLPGVAGEHDQRNVVRKIYGTPGYILGVTAGLPTAALILTSRVFLDSARTAKRAFFTAANLAAYPEKLLPGLEDKNDTRHPGRKFGLGAPGLAAGILGGAVASPFIILARMAAESLRTGKRAFFTMANLAWYPGKIQPGLEDQNDKRHAFLKFGLGGPGFIIGLLSGAAAIPLIGLGRMAADSWRTAKRAFFSVANLAWYPGKIKPGLEDQNETRHAFRQFGLGAPGLIAGLFTGCVAAPFIILGRVAADSWRTARRAFLTMTNLASYPKKNPADLQDKNDDRHGFRKFGLGCPGLVAGLLLGAAAAPFIILGRVIKESWYTAKRAFFTMANFAWYPQTLKPGFDDPTDVRHPFCKYGLGAPGLMAGLLAGAASIPFLVLARIANDSWLTAKRAFFTVINLANYPNKGQPGFEDPKETRHPFRQFGLGAPGLVAGLAAGIVAAPFIILKRMAVDSWYTAKRAFFTMANFAWYPQTLKPGLEDQTDVRHPFCKYGLGAPGLMAGLLVGAASMPFLVLARIVNDSWLTAKRAFFTIINLANYPNKGKPGFEDPKETRHPFRQFVLGGPGLIAGLLAGTAAAPFIILGRIIKSSWLTGKRAFFNTANLAWYPDTMAPGLEDQNDKRSGFNKYGLGAAGLGLGCLLGIAALPVLALCRVLADSWRTGRRAFLSVANLIYYPDTSRAGLSDPNDKRHPFRRFGLGGPGLIAGLLAGLAAAPFMILGRIMTNSWRTGKQAYFTLTNLARYPYPSGTGLHDPNDTRHAFCKYGLGAPGLIAGLFAGAVALPFIAFHRVIKDSLKTARAAFYTMLNFVLYPDQIQPGLENPNDTRHPFRKFGLGGPGLLAGLALGAMAMPVLALGRIAVDSFITAKRAFFAVANLACYPHQLAPGKNDVNDTRHSFRKYGLGAPGLIAGVIAGAVAAIGIAAGRVANQTRLSWQALSGSLINGAVARSWFGGLGGDDRHPVEKTVGGLGYVAALATTLPVAALTWTLRKVPLVAAGLLGLALSPLVASGKAATKVVEVCRGKQRFKADPQDEIEQRFRNLYSSLNVWGRFTRGSQILHDKDGQQKTGTFIRKSITFNASTITEKLLNKLHAVYLSYSGKNQKELETQFAEAAEELKETYASNCFSTASQTNSICDEIDGMFGFIKDYLFDQAKKAVSVPGIYSDKTSWRAAFWGGSNLSKGEKYEGSRENTVAYSSGEERPLLTTGMA